MTAKRSKALIPIIAVKPVKLRARPLLTDVRATILQDRTGVARAMNSGLVALYWHVERRIRQDILKGTRVGYGERIVAALGRQSEGPHFKAISPIERKVHEAVRLAPGRLGTGKD
jgi:hypothetical protein